MINWDRVIELREEVGSEDFLEVVDLFLEEVDDVIERLQETDCSSEIEAQLHFLKGSALNLGFRALGELCSAGERLARDGRLGEFDLGDIFGVYGLSMAEFLAGSAERQFAA